MKEQNKATLRRALDRLPAYDAPPGTWDAISGELPTTLGQRLPSYQPPPAVWNGINDALAGQGRVGGSLVEGSRVGGSSARGASATTAVRSLQPRRRPLRRYLAYAAGLLLLLTAGFGLQDYWANQPTVTVAYSQEAATAPFDDDSELEEESFRRAIAQIEARNEPALNSLRMELDELTEAHREVKAVLTAYGNDPKVGRQLAEIERERSDVYRRIIVEL